MHFVVICSDTANSGAIRETSLEDHRRYVDARADLITFSGPLIVDDGTTRTGQFYVLEVPDRAAAEAFVADDPFTRAGVFSRVQVTRVLPKFQRGRRERGTERRSEELQTPPGNLDLT